MANSAFCQLLGLERGLKSSNLFEKIQTIQQFTAILLDSAASPLIITTAVGKLVDEFVKGESSCRFYVHEALQRSKQAYLLLYNIDDVAAKLFLVLTSNDPVARILSLQMLELFAKCLSRHPFLYQQ